MPGDASVTLSVHERGSGPAVLLCHGFPDLAFGWRHQLGAVASAGFRAIAADGRGYGGSSAPEPITAYDMSALTGDLVGLLDTLDIERAILVGHDWGGWVVWAASVLHPERVAGVVGVCTPYIPFPSVAKHLAEAEMDSNVAAIVNRVMRTGAPVEEVLAAAFADGRLNMNPFLRPEAFPDMGRPIGDPSVMAHYIDVFERTGFRGGINWYRNVDRNAELHPRVGVAPLDLPALMITAEWDPALTPALAEGMHERCSDLEIHQIPAAGHWVHQERPQEFDEILVGWLRRRFPT